MSYSPDADLLIDALVMAFERMRPDERIVHNSDRGAIYTSLAFANRATALGITRSFGSTGDCYDNAAVEAVWATLKREPAWIHGRRPWPSPTGPPRSASHGHSVRPATATTTPRSRPCGPRSSESRPGSTGVVPGLRQPGHRARHHTVIRFDRRLLRQRRGRGRVGHAQARAGLDPRASYLAFANRATALGITRSFGSTGDCYDNAAVEAVWATLKREPAWIHGRRTWPARDLLRSAIFDYIEGFYNPQRTQKRLGYCSPAEFEKAAVA